MSPQQSQSQPITAPATVHSSQPKSFQAMTIEAPTASSAQNAQREEQEQAQLRLRGGELCPGRFCFIIPCPLPCNCCII